MIKKKVSLKTIAEHCGLAATTVSRILNGKPTYCSEAKIAQVREIAREWDYHPHIGYSIMTGKQTNIAGIIFSQPRATYDDRNNRLYMRLTTGLNNLNFTAYTIIMDGGREEQLKKIMDLDERGCRYYIFIGNPLYGEAGYEYLAGLNRCVTGFNNLFLPRNVCCDHLGTFFRYYRLAREEGRRFFRFVLPADMFFNRFLNTLSADDRSEIKNCFFLPEVDRSITDPCDRQFASGHDSMIKLLQQDPGCDAACFYTDYHALGAAAALKELGIAPDKVRLFGLGDYTVSRFTDTRFTTARFDMEHIGDLILENFDGHEPLNRSIPGKIIEYPNNKGDFEK